ncbi:MAG: hypothetical protein ACRDSP_20525, partial [Pseudonocardiaceae bacterium]
TLRPLICAVAGTSIAGTLDCLVTLVVHVLSPPLCRRERHPGPGSYRTDGETVQDIPEGGHSPALGPALGPEWEPQRMNRSLKES